MPRNPFHSKEAKSADTMTEVPPFEMRKPAAGGFEMKGISPSEAPVDNIGAAPIGKESPAVASPFADEAVEVVGEVTNPFGGAKETAVAEPAPPRAEADFGGLPERRTSAPEAPAAVAPAPQSAPAAAPAPVAVSTPVDAIKQLEVRAIFGVDRELNRQELVDRARTLPGIKNLSAVSGEDVVALQTVQKCMANLGFGQREDILLTCPNGVIEFVSQGHTTIAIVRDGNWKPGVRETLIIIAREIDKL